jgi:CubicO group peptidase (beta-lactamase class C family)
MKHFMNIKLIRPALILLFFFFFIYSENNYGLQNFSTSEVLTLDEENHLYDLIFRQMYHRFDSIVDISTHYYGFNGNLLIASGNEIIYQVCSGYEDSHLTKLKPETAFQLASASKQFTAMAILILLKEGKLGLDDPLQRFIPELPYAGVTIRHLLNHTSGVPNYLWYIDNYWASDTELPTNEDMIRILSHHGAQLNFKPGTKFYYSNTGYAILASVVERISGQSFGTFLTERVFRPLGMENASVRTPSSRAPDPSYLSGYRRSRSRSNSFETVMHDGIAGDKGVYASIIDLFTWDQALNNDLLVTHQIMQQAFSAGRLENNREIPYGFGFRLDTEGSSRVVYHYGRWSGFRTAFVKYLPDNLTIIVLNNTSFNGVDQIVAAFRQTWDELAACQSAKKIVETVLTEGVTEGMILYSSQTQRDKEWMRQSGLFPELADYLEGQGKHTKSKAIREFSRQLPS